MQHKLLEQYVEEVACDLKSLPEQERVQELNEIRQHLDALVAAQLELGTSEVEAEREAIRQFGASRQIGRSLTQTWRRRNSSEGMRFLQATVLAVGVFLAPMVVSSIVNSLMDHQIDLSLNGIAFLLTPVLTGLATSRMTQRHALLASLTAVSFLCLLLTVIIAVMALLHVVNDRTPFGILLSLWLLLSALTAFGALVGKRVSVGGNKNAQTA